MYAEFIIIYIGLGMNLAVSILSLIFVLKLRKAKKKKDRKKQSTEDHFSEFYDEDPVGSIAFCTKCATPFSAKEKRCPKCKTLRK